MCCWIGVNRGTALVGLVITWDCLVIIAALEVPQSPLALQSQDLEPSRGQTLGPGIPGYVYEHETVELTAFKSYRAVD